MGGRRLARAAALGVIAAICLESAAFASGVRSLEVVSNRADLVSGGDALVAARLADGVDPAGVRVDVDGADVTSAFALRPDGRFAGLVTGLKLGRKLVRSTDALRTGTYSRTVTFTLSTTTP